MIKRVSVVKELVRPGLAPGRFRFVWISGVEDRQVCAADLEGRTRACVR